MIRDIVMECEVGQCPTFYIIDKNYNNTDRKAKRIAGTMKTIGNRKTVNNK